LKARESEIKEQLFLVQEEIIQEKLRLIEKRYGVLVGAVVVSRGEEYRVTKVDVKSIFWDMDTKPWLEGNPRKKDGTFGKKKRHLYSDWELKSE
jgi:hypothetical protein